MIVFPAIDLYEGRAVRLYRGEYDKMQVYHDDPPALARKMREQGAKAIHVVDLEGARDGTTPNLETVAAIKRESGLFCEIGGGVRSMEIIERYLLAGLDRVILGTAAITDEALVAEAVKRFGTKISVGADLRDGYVAVKGWTQTTGVSAEDFFGRMQKLGVRHVICTDISRDGAMRGTNLPLYQRLGAQYSVNLTASGGVSSLEDIRRLRDMGLYGAIVGKAYYEGSLELTAAVREADAC